MEKFDGFIFNGVSSTDLGLLVEHINKPIAPTISNSRQSGLGMYGDINLGNGYSNKVFNISATFSAWDNDEILNSTIHKLASQLITFGNDGAEYPIIFGDEPNVTYYGTFTSISEATQLEKLTNDSQVTLVFTCSDPKGYMEAEDVVIDTQPFSFTPKGTGEAYPIFYIIPKYDLYETAVAYDDSTNGYIDVGSQLDPTEEENVVDVNPVLVDDPCNTFASWETLTTVPFPMADDIDGKFSSGTNSISVAKGSDGLYNYGDVSKHKGKWFGPMIMHENLNDPVHDFNLMFRLHHIKKYSRAISRGEVYLVDENGDRCGRLYIDDSAKGAATVLRIYLGKSGSEVEIFNGQWNLSPTSGHNGANKTIHVDYYTKGKTKGKYNKHTENLTDYDNQDYFNNSFIQFNIKKVGTACWISVHAIKDDGSLNSNAIIDNKKVTLKDDFALLTIAYYAARFPIGEDVIDEKTGKPAKTYYYGFNSITGYKVTKISNVDQTAQPPEVIAHAGDTIILNTETKRAYLASNGGTESLDKYVSYGSSFPPIQGGRQTTLGISPGSDEADITMTYRPTYE